MQDVANQASYMEALLTLTRIGDVDAVLAIRTRPNWANIAIRSGISYNTDILASAISHL